MRTAKEKIESLTRRLIDSFEQITSFHNFSESMHQHFETEQICGLLIKECQKAIKCLYTEVFLFPEGSKKHLIRFFFCEKENKTVSNGKVALKETPFSPIIKGNTSHITIKGRQKFFRDTTKDFPSTVCVPIKYLDKVEGILCVSHKSNSSNFTPEDLVFLQIITTQGALVIRNNRLLRDYRELFISTVKALTRAIDSKDPYTCDHSRRVTEYAITMARTMKMEKNELRKMELSGLLHDIGKIGVPERVLNKPGKLTTKEFAIMKKHPHYGVNIVSGVEKFSSILPAIKHHHERFDGSGYPCGLKGEDIPLFARILAIADSYDAITSDRAYRKKLPHDLAVKEIIKGAGKQYDPNLIKIFKETEIVFKHQKL